MAQVPEPSVSIVIPTYERPQQLGECLEAIGDLDYPQTSLEVIVVDDGGTKLLNTIVESVADRLNVRLLRTENRGPAAARNEAARVARGDLLAFTDDDCRPSTTWLRALVARWEGAPQVALGGHTVNALVDNAYSATSQLIIDVGYAHNNADPEAARFFTSNNLLVARQGFLSVGGFDASFLTSEDRDFCDRWIAHGFRLRYVPEAIVYHRHDLDLRTFCKQHYAYGRGAYRFHRAHADRWRRQVRIEPSFYARLFLLPFRQMPTVRAAKFFVLLQLWNVVNTTGFLREWLKMRRSRRAVSGSSRSRSR